MKLFSDVTKNMIMTLQSRMAVLTGIKESYEIQQMIDQFLHDHVSINESKHNLIKIGDKAKINIKEFSRADQNSKGVGTFTKKNGNAFVLKLDDASGINNEILIYPDDEFELIKPIRNK